MALRGKWIAAAILATLPLAALPAERTQQEQSRLITESVTLLTQCLGFYEFWAQFAEKNSQPATATMFRDYGRGARVAAAYLLHLESGVNGSPKRMESFYEHLDAQAQGAINRMAALIEQGDSEAAEQERGRCEAALPLQESIIQNIRDTALGR